MSTSLIFMDDGENINLQTKVVVLPSGVLILPESVTTELASLRSRREDIALTLLMYMRNPQLALPFELHLEQVSGCTLQELLERNGADIRIRERIEAGDELVRARYVLQLLYRLYGFGLQAMRERDSHIMCTVALGGGDKHWFAHGAEQLRQAIMCSPKLSQMLGLPQMLEYKEQPAEQAEDTSQYFAFLSRPWYLRLWHFFFGAV